MLTFEKVDLRNISKVDKLKVDIRNLSKVIKIKFKFSFKL